MKMNTRNKIYNVVIGSPNIEIVNYIKLAASSIQSGISEISIDVQNYNQLDRHLFVNQNNRTLLFIDCHFFVKFKQDIVNHTQHVFDFILILDDNFTKGILEKVKSISKKNFLNLLDYILADNYTAPLIYYIAKQAILKKIHVNY